MIADKVSAMAFRTSPSQRTVRTFLATLCGILVAVASRTSHAAAPPFPDFFEPYGHALIAGANIVPERQQVIAFVRGKSCGTGKTLLAVAGEGVPVSDVGRTVYSIAVRADGPGTGQRGGCGFFGDQVTLYFPESHRTTTLPLAFAPGGRRVDLDLDIDLQFRIGLPQLAGDGAP